MKKLLLNIKDLFNIKEWFRDLKSIPSLLLTFCILASVLMNILANKSIINLPYLVQDAGLFFSWMGFLAGDLVVKTFGTKTSIRVSITTIIISLFISVILIVASIVPGIWSSSYNNDGTINESINIAINSVIGNVWYVIIGSAIASFIGLISNNLIQGSLLKFFEKRNNYFTFLIASTTSTIIGQFLDNLIFALIVSINFFGWSIEQALMCSLFGALVELIFEVIFTPITYRISLKWEKEGFGRYDKR